MIALYCVEMWELLKILFQLLKNDLAIHMHLAYATLPLTASTINTLMHVSLSLKFVLYTHLHVRYTPLALHCRLA